MERALEVLGPEVSARPGVHELHRDAQLAAHVAHAALHDVPRAELLSGGAHVHRIAAIAGGRAAGDHPEIGEAREAGHDVIGHSLGEVGELGTGAAMLKGKHGDPEAVVRPHGAGDRRRRSRPLSARRRQLAFGGNVQTGIPESFHESLREPARVEPRIHELARLPFDARIEPAQLLDGGGGLPGASREPGAGGDPELLPEEAGHVHARELLESARVVRLLEMVDRQGEAEPVGEVGIEVHRPAHELRAALEVSGVREHVAHDAERVGVARVQGDRLLRRGAEGGDLAPEEVDLRDARARVLARGVEVHGALRRAERPAERVRPPVVSQGELVDVQAREAGPHVRMPRLAFDELLEAVADSRVLGRRAAVLVSPVAEDDVGGGQLAVRLLLDTGRHGPDERAGRVGDGRHDAVGHVVLHREHVRVVEIAVVGLRPEMGARLAVDELDVDAEHGPGLADAALQDVAGAELPPHRPHVAGLRLEAQGRVARDDGEVGELREAGMDVFREAFGERRELGIGARVREGKDGDPEGRRPRGDRVVPRGRHCFRALPDRRRTRRDGLRAQLPELVVDVAGGLVPVARLLLEASADDLRQLRREIRAELRQGGGPVAQDRGDHVDGGRAVERASAGQHLVHHDAEREDVGSRVDPRAPRLLGRHVGDRAEDVPLARQVRDAALGRRAREVRVRVRRLHPGEAEVEHLDAPLARHHDVPGLQIPVDDPALVRRRQRVRERDRDLEEAGERQSVGRNQRVETVALDELHREKPPAVRLLDREDRDDARMVQGRERARLALETGQTIRVAGHVFGKDLDRDVAAQPRVPRPIDLSHSPRPDRAEDLVGAEAGTGGERHALADLSPSHCRIRALVVRP